MRLPPSGRKLRTLTSGGAGPESCDERRVRAVGPDRRSSTKAVSGRMAPVARGHTPFAVLGTAVQVPRARRHTPFFPDRCQTRPNRRSALAFFAWKAASASGSGMEMLLYPCTIIPCAASTPKARFTELRDSEDRDARSA